MPRAESKQKLQHQESLLSQLTVDSTLKVKQKHASSSSSKKMKHGGHQQELQETLDVKTSRKILDLVRQQQELDIHNDDNEHYNQNQSSSRSSSNNNKSSSLVQARALKSASAASSKKSKKYNDDDDEESDIEADPSDSMYQDTGFDGMDIIQIDEADADLLDRFMTNEPKRQMNLADLVMAKINAATDDKNSTAAGPDQDENMGSGDDDKATASAAPSRQELTRILSSKVVEVYTKVGTLLSRYRSGRLPKTFKILPSLNNWEEILFLTNPDTWTPHASFAATRIFVSNLKADMATRFFKAVLLDRVRDDIAQNKTLNYHLYMALKKALYKPAAFFKGLLLPLCESGTCTLREAVIIGSVVTRVSIPMLHSAAALLKIAEMEYSGSNSLFIRVLLDKKYALPYRVIDALVFHFLRFRHHTPSRTMPHLPVLWHQALLVFAQRYKCDMTEEQKEALLDLIRVQSHAMITPEIRRELVGSGNRPDEEEQQQQKMQQHDMQL